jgi:hypothetical protein
MNPGIERFLILGCLAVLILELPGLLADLTLGDGSAAVLAAEQALVSAPLVAEAAPLPAAPGPLKLEELGELRELPEQDATLALALGDLLPEQPGL